MQSISVWFEAVEKAQKVRMNEKKEQIKPNPYTFVYGVNRGPPF